ncbi:MAG TPA: hypothetical protein VIQ02_14730 [Jiangellaceae bacterium]|jgi:hypothetical protein
MSAATDIRSLLDRVDLFGFGAPVAIPADLYPDYLHYLETRSRAAEASPKADVSEA